MSDNLLGNSMEHSGLMKKDTPLEQPDSQSRESPPLGALDPANITNMVVDTQQCALTPPTPQTHSHVQQTIGQGQSRQMQGFVMPPRQGSQEWQRYGSPMIASNSQPGSGQIMEDVKMDLSSPNQQQQNMQQQGGHMPMQGIENPHITPQHQPPQTPGGGPSPMQGQGHFMQHGEQGMMQQGPPHTPSGGIPASPSSLQHMPPQMHPQYQGQQGEMPPRYGGGQMMMQGGPLNGGPPPQGVQPPQSAGPPTAGTPTHMMQYGQYPGPPQGAQWGQGPGPYPRPTQLMPQGPPPQQRGVMMPRYPGPYPPQPGMQINGSGGQPGGQPSQMQYPPQGQRPAMPPQGQPRTPSYPPPQGTAQYPYPQGANYPPGTTPAGAYPPQHLYQQRQPMNPQMRQPFMSPSTPMMPAGHQPGYPPSTPQTPQTPGQMPYPANGAARFHSATASPHYGGGPDMRSPPLVSPSQRPMPTVNQSVMPAMQQQQQQQQISQMPFCTHEVQVAQAVENNPDMCLVGCSIHIFDHERFATDKLDLTMITLSVRLHGGDVEFGQKACTEPRLSSITHAIVGCMNMQMPHVDMLWKNRKRLITLHWLSDVLAKRRIEVPWKASHFPVTMYGLMIGNLQGIKTVSLSGYDEQERHSIQLMVEAIGARVQPFLTQDTSLVIAKSPSEKTTKAKEWGVPVVNYAWLLDAYATTSPPTNVRNFEMDKYQIGATCPEVISSPEALERDGEHFKHLLMPWRAYIAVSREVWERSIDQRNRYIQLDEACFPSRRLRTQPPAPTEAEIEEALQKKRESNEIEQDRAQIAVAFGIFEDQVKEIMTAKVRYLGGTVVEDVAACTHLVLLNGRRSLELLKGIVMSKNIVSADWVVHSYECKHWMDTLDYIMRDDEMEKILGYNCKRSILKAKHQSVFEDVTFYVTPSVYPNPAVLHELIRLGGGRVQKLRPTPQQILEYTEMDKPLIVISCDADLKLISYLFDANFAIYQPDLVLMAILRQQLETLPTYRLTTQKQAPSFPMLRAPPTGPRTVRVP